MTDPSVAYTRYISCLKADPSISQYCPILLWLTSPLRENMDNNTCETYLLEYYVQLMLALVIITEFTNMHQYDMHLDTMCLIKYKLNATCLSVATFGHH